MAGAASAASKGRDDVFSRCEFDLAHMLRFLMIVVDSMHMEHKIHHDHGIRREDVVPAGRGLEFAPPPRDTEGVRAVFELVGAVMFPTVLGWTVLGAVRATRWWSARRQPAAVTVEPIERLCATVCQLHTALTAEENRIN